MLGTSFDLLLVLLGFGAIVFLHELGHFVAARWAGIRVLAFAVGFGPAILSFRKGLGLRMGSSEAEYERRRRDRAAGDLSPTEYRLNALPFGGYVRMLGQEDGNPYAVSEAPDSYQSCKPWKRMVVISAGVAMNIVTAAVLFVFVFLAGMKVEPAKVGAVAPGSPADRAVALNAATLSLLRPGLQPGDEILSINGSRPNSFNDLMLATAMSERDVPLEMTVARKGVAVPLNFVIKPQVGAESGMLEIGIEPSRSAKVIVARSAEEESALTEAFAAMGLEGVRPGMRLLSVNDRDATDGTELFTALRTSEGKPVKATFGDGLTTITRTLSPRPELELHHLQRAGRSVTPVEHLLGLMPVMTVSQTTERAEAQGLRAGDLFARVDSVEFPSVAQGMAQIQSNKGRTIPITVLRKNPSGGYDQVALPSVEVNAKGQIGFGVTDTGRDSTLVASPLLQLLRPGTDESFSPPAAGVFTAPGTRIVSIDDRAVASFADLRRVLREVTKANAREPAAVTVRFQRPVNGLLAADAPIEELRWTIPAPSIASIHALGWESPVSPGLFDGEEYLLKATSAAEALQMGFAETRRVMLSTYVTFVRLFQGTMKVEHLKGPVGIAHLGTLVAGRGIIWLLFFLALISVNLAVVNFLPLPIVDGGQFLFLLFEQFRGKPVPMAVQSAATLAGVALIGCMFLIVTYNDIRTLLGF